MLDKRKNILEKSVNGDSIRYFAHCFFISYFPLMIDDKIFESELCEYLNERSE